MSTDCGDLDHLLREQFAGRIKRDEPLAVHSSAGVGGPADFFLELHTPEEGEYLVRLCAQIRFPLLVIGHGSNILFTDRGVRGIVARMASKGYRVEEQEGNAARVVVGAGMTWPELAEELAHQGWTGVEWSSGIPGTLAGAMVTNAGAHNEEIGRHVQWVDVLDARGCNASAEGEVAMPQRRRYSQADLQLGNRQSRFREQRRARITASGLLVPAPRALIAPPEIILRLCLNVHRADGLPLAQRQPAFRAAHRRQIDVFTGHVGPLFKDPLGMKASQVIEQAGMNGARRGAAQVSTHNANYLVNQGGARASEMAELLVAIHQQVLTRLGINLEVDLELHGAWDERDEQARL
jgi:UDP-N-acetylmuramate dehydrogenase